MTDLTTDALKRLAAEITSGPWRVGPVDDTRVEDADGNEVAQIDGDYNATDTWPLMEANARAIALVPALLRELIERREADERADLCASGQQVMSGNPKMEKSALERLAELRREVTDEPLHVSGRYFNSHSCTDLTRCGYGGTGEFWNPADGKAISILWGLWRDGGFDALTPAPEAAQMKAALTGKQNPDTLNAGHGPAEVWITHQETAFGQHLSSASEKLWDDEYLRIAPPITTFASNERYVRGDLSGPAAPAPGIVEAEAVPVDDRSLQFRIGDIGNQVHNIACEHQDDEDLSERLADLRSRLWAIAQELAPPAAPTDNTALVDEMENLRDRNGKPPLTKEEMARFRELFPLDYLSRVALAAWVNVRPDQLPKEMQAHNCPATMEAWGRVAEAIRAALTSREAPPTAQEPAALVDLHYLANELSWDKRTRDISDRIIAALRALKGGDE